VASTAGQLADAARAWIAELWRQAQQHKPATTAKPAKK
jgi:hypothetical protein